MFKQIKNKLKSLKQKSKQQNNIQLDDKKIEAKVSKKLKDNYDIVSKILDQNYDTQIREFSIKKKKDAFLLYVDGIADKTVINDNIMRPLMFGEKDKNLKDISNPQTLKNSYFTTSSVKEVKTIKEGIEGCLGGDTALFIDGFDVVFLIDTKSWEHRGVQTPDTEATVRGGKEGFCETLSVNTSLIRRKIKSTNLKLRTMTLGRESKTTICIAYLDNIANPKVLDELIKRLKGIDIDAALESGYIEEFIEDAPFSLFSTVGNTESVDKLCGKILEGKIGVLVDGTPFVLTVPYLFIEGFHASEDYFSRPYFVTQVRLLRFIALFMTLFLPGAYVAITTFHPDILPLSLMITMAREREGLPFPAVIELIILMIIFEVLREAGVRMPRPVGQAVSIVGALVLGDSAVSAGIVSYPSVIIVALAGVMSFLLPPHTDSITLLRWPIVIVGAIVGLFGIIWSFIIIVIHLASLNSFGIPYMYPIMPFNLLAHKDTIFRFPWPFMNKRPDNVGWQNNESRVSRKGKDSPNKNKSLEEWE